MEVVTHSMNGDFYAFILFITCHSHANMAIRLIPRYNGLVRLGDWSRITLTC